MIHKLHILFCDNDHSTDVSFPDLGANPHELQQQAINGTTIARLRREAKKQGWGRHEGADYCPLCMESGL